MAPRCLDCSLVRRKLCDCTHMHGREIWQGACFAPHTHKAVVSGTSEEALRDRACHRVHCRGCSPGERVEGTESVRSAVVVPAFMRQVCSTSRRHSPRSCPRAVPPAIQHMHACRCTAATRRRAASVICGRSQHPPTIASSCSLRQRTPARSSQMHCCSGTCRTCH